MWVLWGDNVTKCSLMIMDMGIAQLTKKTNYKFGKQCKYYKVAMLQNAI
jgi:hypothetical protein